MKGGREEDSALPSKGRFLGGPSFTSLCCYEQIDFVCVCVLAQRSQLANAEQGANSVQIAPSHQHTLYLLVGRFTRCKESEKEGHCLALTLPLLEKSIFLGMCIIFPRTMKNKVIITQTKTSLNLLGKGLGKQGIIFHFIESKEK